MGAHGYRRILLKLSGEVLMGDQAYGIDPDTVARVAEEVKAAQDTGLQLCLVIGGGHYLPWYVWCSQGHGSRAGRLYGHACHRNERAGDAKRTGTTWRAHACPIRD